MSQPIRLRARRTRTTQRRKFERSGAIFLDPSSCNSSVRYSVTLSSGVTENSYDVDADKNTKHKKPKRWTRLELNVGLTDCTRSIGWEAHSIPLAKQKLARAIKTLQMAQRYILKAERLRRRLLKEPV